MDEQDDPVEGWMNRTTPWRAGRTVDDGGVDEQEPVEGWLNSSRWRSAQWRLDEQQPVDEQSQLEAGGGRQWMKSILVEAGGGRWWR